jgi:hypothetical protein
MTCAEQVGVAAGDLTCIWKVSGSNLYRVIFYHCHRWVLSRHYKFKAKRLAFKNKLSGGVVFYFMS